MPGAYACLQCCHFSWMYIHTYVCREEVYTAVLSNAGKLVCKVGPRADPTTKQLDMQQNMLKTCGDCRIMLPIKQWYSLPSL